MNYLFDNIRLITAVLAVAVVYLIVVQVVNDASCKALAESSQPSFARSVVQWLSLCWR